MRDDSRDRKMHREVLESGRYAEVIFRPDRVEGKIPPQDLLPLTRTDFWFLHGSEHELTVPVKAELAGDHWTGSAKFNVPFIDWGSRIGQLLPQVNTRYEIEAELQGSLQNAAAP